MSDILIKRMDMPKTCEDCTLESFCSLWIDARRMSAEPHDRATIRHPDCPLLEIPPHGDLIDRDALPTSRVEWEDIVNAPAIIQAEDGE